MFPVSGNQESVHLGGVLRLVGVDVHQIRFLERTQAVDVRVQVGEIVDPPEGGAEPLR